MRLDIKDKLRTDYTLAGFNGIITLDAGTTGELLLTTTDIGMLIRNIFFGKPLNAYEVKIYTKLYDTYELYKEYTKLVTDDDILVYCNDTLSMLHKEVKITLKNNNAVTTVFNYRIFAYDKSDINI